MSKGMLLYMARLVGERAIALGLFLLASHGVMGARALVWFVTYFASVASAVWLYRTSADTLEHRANIAATKDSTPTWDKVILALFWLLAYFVVYWVAGATADHARPIGVPFVAAIVFYVLSTAPAPRALALLSVGKRTGSATERVVQP